MPMFPTRRGDLPPIEEVVMAPILRQAARLIIIAPDGRVLLFQYEDAPGRGGLRQGADSKARRPSKRLPLARPLRNSLSLAHHWNRSGAKR
jgi:hypothetical protein